MKHLKLFFALFAMLALGVGNAWGQTVTWEKATSIAAGDVVALVCESKTMELSGFTTSGTIYGKGQSYTNNPAGVYELTVEEGSSTGTFSFKNGTKYLYWTSGNSLATNATKNANTSWKVTFSSDNATILNAKDNSRKLQWNASSPRFACYTSNQTAVQLYKKVTSSGGGETPVASLTANPTEIDFGTVYQDATVEDKTVAVNFANLTGSVSYSGLSTPFTATGNITTTGDQITIAANTSTIGGYLQTLTIQSTADSKSVDVTVKMNVVEKTAPTGTFTLYTGDLIEGDYVVVYDGIAMTNTVSSNRLANTNVTITDNKIVDPLAATIWHIAKSGEYWTIYNEAVNSYAASNGTKNQAQMLADGTDDKALWTATKNGDAFNFENKHNASNSVNAKLQRNGMYGWACYAAYSDIRLYRKAGTQYNVNVSATENGAVTANPTSAEKGTTITLTIEPADGYLFDALTVTDASSNPITVTDNTFTMPESDVTVAATFKANEKPAATLTLSMNGVTENLAGSYKQDDVVTLPSITSDCVKEFVGWSANPTCNVAPEYKAGDSYTLASTEQILYAVYADVEETRTTAAVNIHEYASDNSWGNDNGDGAEQRTILINSDITVTISATDGNTGKYYGDGIRIYQTGNPTITISTTSGELKSVNFTFTNDKTGTLLNNGVAMTSGTAVEATGTSAIYTLGNSTTATNGQIRISAIEVTYGSAPTYSNYSTTCSAAPTAEVDPTSVTATAAETTGKLTVTYDNVNTKDVTVALYNNAACTEEFNAGWLTVSLDDDKNITYTVAENTTFAERTAYIQLTAPETTGATEPDVVVIPVTQAAKDKVFASLEELVAADLAKDDEVTVTLNNDVIKEFYIYSSKRCGVVFDVQKDGKDIKIFFNNQTTIGDWAEGGKLSGTLTNVKWTTYDDAWQLAPANTWAWANLHYTEPKAVSTVVVSGAPTKTTYVDGEAFDPAGLTVTVNYNDATSEENPTGVTFNVTPATLTMGQTSVNVTATYNSISSTAYEVTGLTVNDIPTKTVAEFIAVGGTRCYLEGIVSNITNTTYGNFDLTDTSGTIYVYGCLNAAGESKKFAELGVKEGDKIKVIADVYELYDGTTEEAKNVQYVSHISAATITIADITMEVGETKTIAATVVPAEAKVTYTIKENEANAISLSDNVITALAEGTATITATVAEGATYLGNSVDFTVTITPQNIATLTFYFDGGVDDIATTLGMSQKNLGEDYDNSPKLKFDHEDDYVIIHFDERPGKLTYDIKANTGNSDAFSGEFAVQESADGVTYRDLVKYTTISGSKEAKTHNCFDKDTRYIKFIFVAKDNGNVALGNIKIEKSVVTKVTPTIVENAYFSVGNNKYVQFSTGNLQYEVGTNTWSFAENQYDVIGGEAYTGSNNTNYGMNEPGYTGKLDLFGWSSDGKFGVNPSNTDADYGTDGVNEFVDWGTLVNETGWYTLTKEEMNHILARTKDGKKLWALATVCDMNGLILLPDNWNTSISLEYGYVPANFNYTKNQLDAAAWAALEAAGAVFLPEGGTRVGGHGNEERGGGPEEYDAHGHYFHVDNVGSMGYYWLNTQDTRAEYLNCASFLILPGWSEGETNAEDDDICLQPQVWSREKRRGNSVRLVKEVPAYTISVTAENGTVTGAGTYPQGTEVTLTATPAFDYQFVKWSNEATENPLTITVTEDVTLEAIFEEVAATTTTLSGKFSTGEYEYAEFATGNLQYKKEGENETWRFAKQQYQVVGDDNINVGDPAFEGWIDMFGWSADGKFGVNPSNKNEDYYGEFEDWGTNMGEGWSTLSADQWKYLLYTRTNAKNLKQIARVGSVVGIMLFPDVWNAPLTVTAQRDSYFEVDIHNYTLEQWAELEEAGAIFLPAAGRRTGGYGNIINKNQEEENNSANLNGEYYRWQDNTNIYCYYWTSTINEDKDVSYLHNIQALGDDKYTIGTGVIWGEKGRYGQSVRLAKVTSTLIEIGDGNNSAVITENAEKTVNVQVNRTFEANNGYYTICLPFDLAAGKIGTALQISSVTENVVDKGINVVFTKAETLLAGQPYLVLPSTDLTNPIFEGVTIVNTAGGNTAAVSGAGINITFTGIINGVGEQTNGTTDYWVGNNGYLYNGKTEKLGLRAFFTITDEAGNPTKVRARVVTREDAATGFENITNGENTTIKVIENGQLIIIRNGEKFNAQGQKL